MLISVSYQFHQQTKLNNHIFRIIIMRNYYYYQYLEEM
jgi:hypothetical protein